MAKRTSRKSKSRTPDSSEAPPLSGRELYNSKIFRKATRKMPDKVRAALLLPEIEPFKVSTVDRKALARYSDDPIKPHAPDWMDVTAKPKEHLFAGKSRGKVLFRGIEFEPLWVFGADNRWSYYDTSYPWCCVCKINTGDGGYGSGVIVGPRHVLTASHVVNWASASGANGSVEVLRSGGTVSAMSPIVRVHAFIRLGGFALTHVDEDYAVLITADRIGDSFGWLGTRTYNSSWDDEHRWFNIGYASDIASGSVPIRQSRRALNEHSFDLGGGRAMDTDADMVSGQSGGPMAGFWPEGVYVVAVIAAQVKLTSRQNWCAGGSDLTRLVRRARDINP